MAGLDEHSMLGWFLILLSDYTGFVLGRLPQNDFRRDFAYLLSADGTDNNHPQAACVDLCFQGLLCVFGGSVSYISFFTPFVNVEMTGDSAQGQTLPEGWDMKPDPKAPQSWGRGVQTSSYLSSLFWRRTHFRNSGVSLLQTSKAQASCAHPLSGLSLSTPDGQLQPQPGFISLQKVQLLKTKEFH